MREAVSADLVITHEHAHTHTHTHTHTYTVYRAFSNFKHIQHVDIILIEGFKAPQTYESRDPSPEQLHLNRKIKSGKNL
jgi:molybdopterin-guanine dinucleotide biosynthesis protein